MGECKGWTSERVCPVECLRISYITFFVQSINKVVPCFTLANHITTAIGILLDINLPVVAELLKNLCFGATHVRGTPLTTHIVLHPKRQSARGSGHFIQLAQSNRELLKLAWENNARLTNLNIPY